MSGDLAVLTYHFVTFAERDDGTEDVTSRWNATLVYFRAPDGPQLRHSHWSLTKQLEALA